MHKPNSTPQDTSASRLLQGAEGTLSVSLKHNMDLLDTLFRHVDITLCRKFENAACPDLTFCVYYSDGVSDSTLINEFIIKPLILSDKLRPDGNLAAQVQQHVLTANDIRLTDDVKDAVESITYGDTVLLMENSSSALIVGSKKFELRGISEPEGEKVLSGPREGFTEGIMQNLSMVRRRLRTHQLKLRMSTLGVQSQTSICIAYMDNIVNHRLLGELYRRLKKIEIDAILDANYITEFIGEKSHFGFNTTGATERPDVVAAKLLEGRIAVFVDGTPVVLTLPYLFIENFQSNEDYYISPIYNTYARILRILSFFLTITIPAAYISVVAFHHEVLPTALLLKFGLSRQNVPLPAALECFVMLLVFDILRETGVRMPGHVGQALGIVGALVIGQAAVEANLIAAPMIIIVAFTGITILVVPRLTTAGLFIRYLCLVLASMLGLTGWMVGMALWVIHVINLQSLGVPYLLPTDRLGSLQTIKDTFIRSPWPKMLTRTRPLSSNMDRARPLKGSGKG